MYNTGSPLGSILRHSRFYMRHHTPKRLANLVRTAQALLTRPIHTPNMPISMKIESSAACQLRCPGCLQSDPSFKEKTRGRVMSLDLFNSLLDQAADHLYRIQFYYNGEPFINDRLLDMIGSANKRGVGSQVSTNFSFNKDDLFYRDVVESGLEHLIISMDGTDAETYSKYRVGGRYELVEHGLRQVVKWKKRLGLSTPIVEWQFIIFEHNKHQIEQAKKMASEIGVDRLCLKYDGYSDPDTWEDGHKKVDRRTRRMLQFNSCLWLWGALVVDWNGVVNPCCNKAMNYEIGDLTNTSLRQVWNSDEIKELRRFVRLNPEERKLEEFRSHPCQGCNFIM